MDKQWFLLRVLGVIFASQIVLLGFEMHRCFEAEHPLEECPYVEDTYKETFNVMIATTLALLTGTAISNKDV